MTESAAPPLNLATARRCAQCGYDLRGKDGDRCPECGFAADTPDVLVPWERRRHLGRIRAFIQTVWLATFRPKRLARAMGAPVDYRAAERFRWIVVALASIGPIALVLLWRWDLAGQLPFFGPNDLNSAVESGQSLGMRWDLNIVWYAGAILPAVLPLGVVVTLLIWTTASGYWHHPRPLPLVRQNRAVAISRYGAAPLLMLLLPSLACIPAARSEQLNVTGPGVHYDWELDRPAAIACYVGAGLVLLACWWSNLALLAHTTRCRRGRMVCTVITLPLSCALAAAVGLIVIPAVIGLVWLIIESWR